MAFRALKAGTLDLLLRQLNGLVLGKREITLAGRDSRPNPDTTSGHDLYKHPVAGLTLIFTTPAATVTFSDNLDWKEIMAEIAATAGLGNAGHLLKTNPNGGSVLAFWDDTTPVTMSDAGTANSYFGFSVTPADPALVQEAVDATDVQSIQPDPLTKQWIAVIND